MIRPRQFVQLAMAISIATVGCRIGAEKCAPTDARRIYVGAGEEAVRRVPTGVDSMYYGYKPTCWRPWPQGWEQFEQDRCGVNGCILPPNAGSVVSPTPEQLLQPIPEAHEETIQAPPASQTLPPANTPAAGGNESTSELRTLRSPTARYEGPSEDASATEPAPELVPPAGWPADDDSFTPPQYPAALTLSGLPFDFEVWRSPAPSAQPKVASAAAAPLASAGLADPPPATPPSLHVRENPYRRHSPAKSESLASVDPTNSPDQDDSPDRSESPPVSEQRIAVAPSNSAIESQQTPEFAPEHTGESPLISIGAAPAPAEHEGPATTKDVLAPSQTTDMPTIASVPSPDEQLLGEDAYPHSNTASERSIVSETQPPNGPELDSPENRNHSLIARPNPTKTFVVEGSRYRPNSETPPNAAEASAPDRVDANVMDLAEGLDEALQRSTQQVPLQASSSAEDSRAAQPPTVETIDLPPPPQPRWEPRVDEIKIGKMDAGVLDALASTELSEAIRQASAPASVPHVIVPDSAPASDATTSLASARFSDLPGVTEINKVSGDSATSGASTLVIAPRRPIADASGPSSSGQLVRVNPDARRIVRVSRTVSPLRIYQNDPPVAPEAQTPASNAASAAVESSTLIIRTAGQPETNPTLIR